MHGKMKCFTVSHASAAVHADCTCTCKNPRGRSKCFTAGENCDQQSHECTGEHSTFFTADDSASHTPAVRNGNCRESYKKYDTQNIHSVTSEVKSHKYAFAEIEERSESVLFIESDRIFIACIYNKHNRIYTF